LSLPKSVYKRLPKRMPHSLGFSGYALDFDGVGDYVHVPDNVSLNFGTGAFSLGCWFKFDASASDPYPTLLNKNHSHNSGLYLWTGGSQILFRWGDGTNYSTLASTSSITDNKWHHIFVFRDSSGNTKLFLDGKQEDSGSGAYDVSNSDPLYIGQNWNISHWKGQIDEPRIYNRALSAEEIRRNMLNYHSPIKDGLVGWWRFEEGTGLTAHDRSGNGNHGTMKPAADPPTWVRSKKWELRGVV